jgi:hypothetical protein
MEFKHTDDDGELSVFASGDELLFACNKGHYWSVPAKSGSTTARTRDGLAGGGAHLDALTERFGPGLAQALGLEQ